MKIQAGRLDSNVQFQGFKTQTIGQESLAQHDAFILDLDHLFAIGTDDMKSGRRLFTVHLVVTVFPIEFHLSNQVTVEQHWQRAIGRR